MKSTIQVRDARSEDFEAVAAMTNHYIEHTPIHFGYQPMPPAEFRATWEATREHYPWFVAVEGSDVLGYAKAGVWRSREAYRWTAEAGVYVVPEAHARGIGKDLYHAVIEDLRARGFHSVVGGVTLPNAASERLHASLGFTKVGVFTHAGFKFGAWHDVGFWQLMLNEGPPRAS